MELADNRIEIPTLCMSKRHLDTPKKARFNSRVAIETGQMMLEGEQEVVDTGNNDFEYIPLCGDCYALMEAEAKDASI